MRHPQAGIPETVKTIIKTLEERGFEAFIVGGAVRDMIMERQAVDWDVATSASTGEVADLFADLTKFSLQHGTITLVYRGRHFEVSTYRGSSHTLEDDLGHRDFTINAMAWRPGEVSVIDPYGGRKDIERRLIRAVGSPGDRFNEDPLRMLRAVRIRRETGFSIDRPTGTAIRRMAPLLAGVAKERIRDEAMRILLSEKPSRGFHEMERSGLLKEIIPDIMERHCKGKRTGHLMETVDRVGGSPALRLAALFHDLAEPGEDREPERDAEEVMRRFRFSERMISHVMHLVKHHRHALRYEPSWGDSDVRRLVREAAPEHLENIFLLCTACLAARGKDAGHISELAERARSNIKAGAPFGIRDLNLDGRKVMAICGIEKGPEVAVCCGFFSKMSWITRNGTRNKSLLKG